MPKRVKVEIVKKDYDVNKGINIPQKLTHHSIDGKHLFIAPEKASWISTNEMGNIFLDYFRNGYSIKQVINELRLKNIENEVITSELRDFLVNVENLEGCSQCDLEYICFGGRRLNNITYNNSILKPHCPPEKKEELYKKLVVRDSFDALSIWLGDYKN